MTATPARALFRRLGLLCAALALSACMGRGPELDAVPYSSLDQSRQQMALLEAKEKQSSGQRVWCVPFARTASGVQISGDAKTWWKSAKGSYARGNQPRPGAVMAFSATRGMSRGHVAVVSEVVSEREIRVNHANWVRNKVQLDMKVIDISRRGDWSEVKVERVAGEMGVSSYPVSGFIYPN
ncbi:CHAP domain-containing protein [Pseudogemmobacter faecipullorum]|uniref:CHAP domain-containing protein n=1 Tax=Pseudogemmobacter faecipullorum TaxID=2755041 RepID=A0ABS8CHS7_9RHOB|nr:CHAP domain-containing protein [Pseudogemmobacter faecipullorum]MCB5408942.1 CHAP domain-containing protein [Pseudogemmobacter faecipullorum]